MINLKSEEELMGIEPADKAAVRIQNCAVTSEYAYNSEDEWSDDEFTSEGWQYLTTQFDLKVVLWNNLRHDREDSENV